MSEQLVLDLADTGPVLADQHPAPGDSGLDSRGKGGCGAASSDSPPDEIAGLNTVRATIPAAPLRTLGDVIAALGGRADLSATRRRDLVSALRTVARLLHRPPEKVAVDLPGLRRMLAEAHPATVGMSAKRFANIRADLMAALRLAQPLWPEAEGIGMSLSPSWRALHAICPTPEARWRLPRFMRWCSSRGIAPAQVDLAVLKQFGDDLEASSLVRSPKKLCYQVTYAWNCCVKALPAWPQILLKPPRNPRAWALPWTAFPDAFRTEVDIWMARLAAVDLLDEDGPSRPLRPASLRTRRLQIRLSASALVLAGTPVAELRTLADLVQPERFRSIMHHLLQRYGQPNAMTGGMADALKAIARYHVRLPEIEMDRLRAMSRRVQARQVGMKEKNRNRLGGNARWGHGFALSAGAPT